MKKIRETKGYEVWKMDDGKRWKRWKDSGKLEEYRPSKWGVRKLSDRDVIDIYFAYSRGMMSSGGLSRLYGVSDRLIMRIVKGRYRNITGKLKDVGVRYMPGRIGNRVRRG